MHERGAALIEALVVTATAGLIWAAAVRVLADLPAQSAAWEEASVMRQGLRVVEARMARMAAGAAPIEVVIEDDVVRVPGIWPRRLGLFRPGRPGELSTAAVTFLSRAGPHRSLTLGATLAAAGGPLGATPDPGCGSETACGLQAGDLVLAIARDGTCGLFRVSAASPQLMVDALMEPGAPGFPPGSSIVPVLLDVISFDDDEGTLRRYDGYRSENAFVDGVSLAVFGYPGHPGGSLADGPFVGAGPLGWDIDQLLPGPMTLRLTLVHSPSAAAAPGASFAWNPAPWP